MSQRPLDLPPRELIAAYGADAPKLRAAIKGLSDVDLKARPVAGKWSTLEVVIHLADAEVAFADRIKRILAMDKPQLIGWDENGFAARLHYHDQSADDAVKLIEAIRANTKRILDLAGEAELLRTGVHSERGEQSVVDVLSYCVWHLNHHLKFIQDKRKALGK
jgi:uncharacterized damage-inducible protein DinB